MIDLRHHRWMITSSSNPTSSLYLPVMNFWVLTLHGPQY